jgi:glycosyltransferase involved in cell wall biosynthesis
MRLGILADGLVEWQGGIDFLRMVGDCLRLAVADQPVELVLLYPRLPTLAAVHVAALPWAGWLADRVLKGQDKSWREVWRAQQDQSSRRRIARVREALGPALEVRRYRDDAELAAVVRSERLDGILPCARPLADSLGAPWVGYLFDFQHRHLPQLFSAADRATRDQRFAAMAKQARQVIVNSRAVADDCRRFLGTGGAEFVPLPFGAAPSAEWLVDEPGRCAPYGLPARYFLIANQFWTHKNHRRVFEALSLLGARAEAAGADLGVVCTGSTVDARDPGYFPSLERYLREQNLGGRVRILGHLPKRDQIEIMKGALAVVQPTLFEGGPGGGAVYDAISLGVPALVSDLPVNRELDGQGYAIQFFDPANAAALADLMLEKARASRPPRPPAAALLAEGRSRRQAVGRVLMQTLHAAGMP